MEEILREVRKGSLDENPRLCKRIVCSRCGKTGKRLIDFLKEGHFEVGKSERINVIQPGQYALFNYEEETATAVSIRTICQKCGHEEVVSDPILTVEYLIGICKCKKPRITYA